MDLGLPAPWFSTGSRGSGPPRSCWRSWGGAGTGGASCAEFDRLVLAGYALSYLVAYGVYWSY